MAPRPVWKGYLKLSLVTCAVELSSATTESEKVRFRVLNRATGNTVRRQYVDAETGKPVSDDDQVRGYEKDDHDFLPIEEDEIDAVQIESSHTLSLDGFVAKADIGEVYLDTPYYMTPADEVSEEAFAVIREAMAQKKMAGLARIVLFRREHPCLIEPRGKGMLLTTLRYGSTVRDSEAIFDDIDDVPMDEEMLGLATKVIEKRKAEFDPSTFDDQYEDAVLKLIQAKQKGKRPPKVKAAAPEPSNVVNLFDALKKSLTSDSGGADRRGGTSSAESRPSGAKTRPKKARAKAASRKRKSA